MVHKNISIKNKVNREFEVEIIFQDTTRANAKTSEPTRTTQTQIKSTRDLKKGGTSSDKKM
ncbi:MAG: hypothetical protein K2Q18_00860 [Bdellovibrionales bacterium]|nr:hypothetical protein [Bdellovibrionales bacterium]